MLSSRMKLFTNCLWAKKCPYNESPSVHMNISSVGLSSETLLEKRLTHTGPPTEPHCFFCLSSCACAELLTLLLQHWRLNKTNTLQISKINTGMQTMAWYLRHFIWSESKTSQATHSGLSLVNSVHVWLKHYSNIVELTRKPAQSSSAALECYLWLKWPLTYC